MRSARLERYYHEMQRRAARGASFVELTTTIQQSSLTKRDKARLVDFLATLITRAVSVGYAYQNELFDESTALSPAVASQVSSFALSQAEATVSRLGSINGVLSPALAALWLSTAVEQQTKQGFDAGQAVSGAEHGAVFKTWVRTAAAKSPRAHSRLEGTKIPFSSLFTLPDGTEVRRPRDWQAKPDASEWVRCKHGLVLTRS